MDEQDGAFSSAGSESELVEDLIEESRKGNREAFSILIRKYSQTVYAFAFRLMNNIADAEDLCQEVFIQAYRGIKKFESRSAFSTWLYRITVNLWKNKLKEYAHQGANISSLDELVPGEEKATMELPDTLPSLDELMDKETKITLIKESLEKIHPLHKAVIILRDIEGKSYSEIAEIMDCPLGTVQSRLWRAREELRLKVLNKLRDYREQKK